MKYVWIVGAGFSRPLGGPLLIDFFTRRSVEEAVAWLTASGLTEHRHVEGLYLLAALYTKGQDLNSWADAEQFVDRAMTAPSSKPVAVLLEGQVQALGNFPGKGNSTYSLATCTAQDLARWCSFYVAAICSGFLEPELSANINEVPESWAAYCNWFDALDENHTILTFNYDRVLHMLASRRNERLHVPTVHYMHGRLPPPDEVARLIKNNEAITGIGLPGPDKKSLVVGGLEQTWASADSALRNCDEVVIMGYSIPRSDSHSRMWLQRAIAWRAATTITLVLGERNPDVARVKRAFKFRNTTDVLDSEEYVEEFLTRSMATGALQLR